MRLIVTMSTTRRTRAPRTGRRPSITIAFTALAAVLALNLSVAGQAHAQGQPPAPSEAVEEGLYSCGKARGPVSVSFKPEVALTDLITWAMGFTCKNFVYGAGIGGRSSQVTIIAPKKMTAQQAWSVFLVALQTMNLTVVPQGNVLTIVESAQANTEPLPIYRRGAPPATAQLMRMVVRPEHIAADELAKAIDGIKSQHGKVVTLPSANILILTDTGNVISKMRSIIAEVDQPLTGERLYLIRVRHADATELANKLQEILGSAGQGGGGGGSAAPSQPARRGRRNADQENVNVVEGSAPAAGGAEINAAAPTKIISDERTNSLLLLSSEAGYLRVRSLVQRLDVAIDGGGSGRIHVYPLEHGDAEEMSNTLTAVITGAAQPTAGGGGRGGNAGNARPPRGGTDEPGAPAFEGQVRVTHDKPTNSLVVVASVKDFFALRDVIEKLDTARRQVFIEAMIIEVTVNDSLNIGTSFHGGQLLDDGSLVLGGLQVPGKLQSIVPGALATSSGLLGGLLGPLLNTEELLGTSIPSFGVLFQAVATSGNANVLSTPHILTTDNEEAEISVGQNIPYQSGIAGVGAGGGQGGNFAFPVQSVQRQDVALTLKITPHINASDMVRLEIDQEISDVGDRNFGGLGPSWSKRTVKTTVVVRDQQSIVIGGLMQDRITYNETKVPLLGDIPLLGYLFKYSERQKSKTNLLILLTPYVIKSQMDIEQIVQRKTRESREFARTFSNFDEIEYRPQIDYRRKRGLLEEINRAGIVVERDAQLLREATRSESEMPEGLIEYTPVEVDVNVEAGVGIEAGVGEGDEVEGGNPGPAPAGTPPSPRPNR
jgi:general secretion pathway protein D